MIFLFSLSWKEWVITKLANKYGNIQFCINAQVKFSNEKNVTQKVLHSLVF